MHGCLSIIAITGQAVVNTTTTAWPLWFKLAVALPLAGFCGWLISFGFTFFNSKSLADAGVSIWGQK